MATGELLHLVRNQLAAIARRLVAILGRTRRRPPIALALNPHALEALPVEARAQVVRSLGELPHPAHSQVVIVVVSAPPPQIDLRPLELVMVNGLQLIADQVVGLQASLADAGVVRRPVNEVEARTALADVGNALRELRETVREELCTASRLRLEHRAGNVAGVPDNEDLVARRSCDELPEVARIARELQSEWDGKKAR